MPALDFCEISAAHVADGNQDSFELFARDFFEALGFEIEDGPDRGQDGGRDLLISEERTGPLGNSHFKWLVSCKHKAHSGKAVGNSDEQDIRDRLESHGANGFIGFYSTIISTGLTKKLNTVKGSFEVKIFDREAIETALLSSLECQRVARRYFFESFTKWEHSENYIPANIFEQYEPLNCVVCGKDLLDKESIAQYEGIVVWVEEYSQGAIDVEAQEYIDFYWVCKGDCDEAVARRKYSRPKFQTSWEDISDIVIPAHYVTFHITIMNHLRGDAIRYADRAFEQVKEFDIRISQLVVRNQSEAQLSRLASLAELPPEP